MKETEEHIETGLEIAVIGLAGRFPGAKNIAEFWANLKNGVESLSFLSEEELAEINPVLRNHPNYVNAKGGILQDIEYFDASFFNYTPLEAELMAPSMRIFHQCSWEALEDSGYAPEQCNGLIGLYAGVQSTGDWETLANSSPLNEGAGATTSEGLANRDFMSTLVAYKLNLKGPSFSVNTTCSTSLVAIHLACQGLLSGDCDMALAGGVSIRVGENKGYLYEEGMIASPDGHCRAFDAHAGGAIAGNGIGIVVLKRLEDALNDNDYIYAVIKGSAINNDGNRKVGYTAPSIEGQAEVIRKAHKMAEVNPEDISYVEAHGTATPLGDVTEIEALKIAFNTEKKHFCALGSVKTNIGHLDTAAGVAGFIKTVLALNYRLIPPSLHFKTPNPKIDFKNSPFYVNTTLKEWQNNESPFHNLRAGVSSFGIGGTNAHVILEEYGGALFEKTAPPSPPAKTFDYLFLMSAKTQTALDKMTENMGRYLKENPGANLADVAYTLQTGRKRFPFRRKLVGKTSREILEKLSSQNPRDAQSYQAMTDEDGRNVIFMFPGLGPQYTNMGLDLYQTEPIFREAMNRCFEILNPLGYDLKKMIFLNKSDRSYESYINEFDIAQLAIFIIEYALAKLLMAWGIKPHAMIGYSFGEYAAACIAGVFTPEDILHLLVTRGKLIAELPPGMMLSVPLPAEQVKPLLQDDLAIGIDNGSSCVVSGPGTAVKAFEKEVRKKKLICMPLESTHALHSPMMDPILTLFEKETAKITLNPPQIPYISTVTGDWIKVADAISPKYWARQLRDTVCFARGLQKLLQEPHAVFLEVGPGRDIGALVSREIEISEIGSEIGDRQVNRQVNKVISLIRQPKKEVPDDYYLRDKIGLLWLYGVNIDWKAFHPGEKRYRIPLPTYPFEKHRFWKLPEQQKKGTAAKQDLKQDRELADCFYAPSWKQTIPPLFLNSPGDAAAEKRWLIFLDDAHDLGTNLAGRLKTYGSVITVSRGDRFSKVQEDHYIIDPACKEDYDLLVGDISTAGEFPNSIVHLWGLDAADTEQLDKDFFNKCQDTGYYSLLFLAQALVKHDIAKNFAAIKDDADLLCIEIVTDNIHAVTGEEKLVAEKATILGLCKTIPQEYPNICCRNIDIPLPGPGIDYLAAEFMTPPGEDGLIVAYRGNSRWVQCFGPLKLERREESPKRLRKQGVYLMTGGLGNDSFTRSKYLAQNFAARLALIGRTPLPAGEYWDQHLLIHGDDDAISIKIKRIRELEALGATVLPISADAADEFDMRMALQQIDREFGELNGVIHAAGVTGIETSRLLMELGRDESEWHFQPKVYGLYVLEKVLAGRNLDFCLVTSSVASLTGGIGLSAYTAASTFMDTFTCRHNRMNPVPWLCLNWEGADPGITVEAFKRLLSLGPVDRLVFSQSDLQRLIRERTGVRSTTGHVLSDDGKAAVVFSRPDLSTPYVAPRDDIEQGLADIWQRFFGVDRIGVTDDLFDLGGDSLKALNILSIINKELNAVIPIKEFFDHPTIEGVAKYLAGAEKGTHIPVEPAEKKEYYVLSSAQERMYVFQRMNPGSTVYNSPMVKIIEGDIDAGKLANIFKKLIARHESLRTSIAAVTEEPVQVVHDAVEFEIEILTKVLGSPETLFQKGFWPPEAIIKSFIRPFDLSCAPFMRVGLIKTKEMEHLLMVDVHHIIADGISMGILINEFLSLYEGKPLPGLRVQYKDYAQWQKRMLEGDAVKRQEEFWLKEFAGEMPVLELPSDYVRPQVPDFAGNILSFEIDGGEARALKVLALAEGATFFMAMLAVYNIFLAKISGQETIVVGTPTAGRHHADLERVIGMFIDTLALKNDPAGEKTVREFLREVKGKTFAAFANQDYQYEDLVEKATIDRDTGRNPLFDVMFMLHNLESPGVEISGLKLKPYTYTRSTSKFDLTLLCVESDGDLPCSFEYSTRLFKQETIERFIGYLKNIITSLAANPDKPLWEIDILPEEEKRRLAAEFNDTALAYPTDKTIYQLFEGQVDTIPDHVALVFRDETLTFRHFDERANRLAGYLQQELCIRVGDRVAVLMERSVQLIVSLMGVMKSGAAYVPLDPALPLERLRVASADAGIGLAISQRRFREKLAPLQAVVICMDDPGFDLDKYPALRPGIEGAGNPAYVMYTSGSSGVPKGVLVEHRTIVNTLIWRKNFYKYKPGDVSLQNPPYYFDSSVTDIFTPLLGGARLVLAAEHERADLEALKHIIKNNRVSHFIVVPAFYNVLVEEIAGYLTGLKMITCAGEYFPSELIRKHFKKLPTVRIFNEYGPTENSVNTTAYELSPGSPRALIGKPISNVGVYLLDRNHCLVPTGVAGEICLFGSSLARGYLNNPELTAEKFINKSFAGSRGGFSKKPLAAGGALYKIYKTGDLGRWLPDGNLDFLGRIDTQVKIRGMRIEIAEIENHIMRCDVVKEVVVLVRKGPGAEKYLCAYIVRVGGGAGVDLKEYLSERLPGYMIPTYFIFIDAIPLLSNGKINRNALPDPGISVEGVSEQILPRNWVEGRLAEIWAGVLNIPVDTIGIDADFFQMGGHSLKATIVASRIHKVFDVKVPLLEIFTNPTIRGLAKYIGAAVQEAFIAIGPAEKKEYYPLSPAQKRLFLVQRMGANSTAYNLPMEVMLTGGLDKEKSEWTFRKLIARHESLRTSFEMLDDEPVQRIHEKVEFGIEYKDLAAKNAKTREEETKVFAELFLKSDPPEAFIKHFIRPFDLSKAPLLRVGLLKVEEEKHILMIDMHHIISDGASHAILKEEFNAMYSGKAEDFPPLRLQYKDYSQWLNNETWADSIREQESYWLNIFADGVPVFNLPTDFPRPLTQSFAGCTVEFQLTREETRALKVLAKETGATLYMSTLSVFAILLSKLSGQEDIVVGAPVMGRRHTDLEPIVGMFVNTLVMRSQPAGEKLFKNYLEEVKAQTLKAFENQEYPFEELVGKLNVARDTGRNPLFDVVFNLLNIEEYQGDFLGMEGPGPDHDRRREGTSKFDLTLSAVDHGERLFCIFEYSAELFKPATIERFIAYFKKISTLLSGNPGQKIAELEIISESDKHWLLYEFNDTGAEYPREKTIHECFAEQVEKSPDSIAIVGADLRVCPVGLTYRELDEQSDRMAGLLIEKGVGPDAIAAIMMECSVEMMIAIFGILKAGGAYLPIEPGYPQERIDYILKDSGAKLMIGRAEERKSGRAEFVFSCFFPASPLPRFLASDSSNLAYLIYTSGSTGRPKGVAVEHSQLVNFVYHMYNRYDRAVDVHDRCLSVTNIMFDVSLWEFFLPLTFGAGLVLFPRQKRFDVLALAGAITREQITLIYLPPALLPDVCEQLKTQRSRLSLNKMLVGVEPIRDAVLEGYMQLNPGMKIINGYGPTETTICASSYDYYSHPPQGEIVPIGVPLSNNRIVLLDAAGYLAPRGIPGEICISGDGVARGYLNNPELTAEKFNKSFAGVKGGLFQKPPLVAYHTGDLAQFLPDGNIRFLGRKDHQVKIRGFRIELGEIEKQLMKHPLIKEAVVINRNGRGRQYLCAYFAAARPVETGNIPAQELKTYLQEKLPAYMVPNCFVRLEKIPLNPNGKVDHKALPLPAESDFPFSGQYQAPETNIQRIITETWQAVLGREKIGIHDNFFDLGGNSLDFVRVSNKLKEKLGQDIPVAILFSYPTISSLEHYLAGVELPNVTQTVPGNFVMLNGSPQSVGNIFFVHEILGDVGAYMEFSKQLGVHYNCWGVEAEKLRNYVPQNAAIEEIAAKYISQMKEIQPRGPYFIATWSWGGHLGLEMTLQLEQMGERLAMLVFFDCLGPDCTVGKTSREFTLEGEKAFLRDFFISTGSEAELEQINDIDRLWTRAVEILTGNAALVEQLRQLLIENALALPDYDELTGEELIQYLNLNRTHAYASAHYLPGGKIHTPIQYFAANQNTGRIESWKDYCHNPVVYHEISGDHHSIFRNKEQIAGSARLFNEILEKGLPGDY